MTKLAVLGTALIGFTATVAAQQNGPIRVFVNGTSGLSATVLASAQPYFEGGPVAKMYLPSGTDARMRDGRRIVGFDFTAWTEGDATRGQVFALVGTSGSPDVDLRYRADLLERREFASFRLRTGESVPITEMQSLGLEPMVVRTRTMGELFAELERMRERLQQR